MLGVVVLSLASDAQRLPPGGRGVGYLGVALAWGFVAVGSYVTLRRPDRHTGVLMIALGLVTLTTGLQFSDAAGPWLIGVLTDTLVLAVFVHLLLAFPSGRLEGVAERIVVGAGYVVATLLQLPPLLFGLEYNCAGTACPRNLLRVAREPDLAASFSTAQTLAELAVIACALVLVVQHWRAAGRAQRRGLEPVLGLGAAIAAFGAVSFAVQEVDAGDVASKVAQLLFLSALALLPVAFLAGLVRSRFFRTATVARLLDRLARDAGPLQVRDALRDALGDPSLTIAYRLSERGGHVDPEGRPLALPPPDGDRVATEIGTRPGRGAGPRPPPVRDARAAARRHRRRRARARERPARGRAARAARGAARLARPHRRGRRRRAPPPDARPARRRAAAARLADARPAGSRAGSGRPTRTRHARRSTSALVDARAAVEELRELAAGIHPAVLTQRGLDAALESLATRAPVPGRATTSALDERLPDRGRERRLLLRRRGARERRQARGRHVRRGRRARGRARSSCSRCATTARAAPIPPAAAACAAWRTASARSTGASRSTARRRRDAAHARASRSRSGA